MTLSKILNIGSVKDTMAFSFEFFAISNGIEYNIASVSQSNMIVTSSMISIG